MLRSINILLLLKTALIAADVYSSVSDLKQIAIFQFEVARKLSDGPFKELPYVTRLRELSDCYLDGNGAITLNPLSGIHLISSFTFAMNELRESPGIVELIRSEAARANLALPQYDDMVGAVNALARLQLTYDISVRRILDGYFFTLHNHSTRMAAECAKTLRPRASDCELISRFIRDDQPVYMPVAKSWMAHAIRLSVEDDGMSLVDAVRLHATGSDEIGRALTQLADQAANADYDFDMKLAVERLLPEDECSALEPDKIPYIPPDYKQVLNIYLRLCRSSLVESDVSETESSRLFCEYSTLGRPYFFIGPVKTEWIVIEPPMRIYHDVMSDREIEAIQTVAKQTMNRSEMYKTDTDYYDRRLSKTAWLSADPSFPENDIIIKQINERSDLLTGLNGEGSEHPQVLNYGLGGHFEPHYDRLPDNTDDYWAVTFGHRVATLMYYLSDVDAGGSTAFIQWKVAIRPRKGSAVLWYNTLRRGDNDPNSMHAGCPVVVGEKWVVNKWYHELAQFNILPCTTNPMQ